MTLKIPRGGLCCCSAPLVEDGCARGAAALGAGRAARSLHGPDVRREQQRVAIALADAKVVAVGDDWKSIFRSPDPTSTSDAISGAGSAGHSPENERPSDENLGRAIRFVDKFALAARRFVLRNPTQLSEMLAPAGAANQTASRIAWTRRENTGSDRYQFIGRDEWCPEADSNHRHADFQSQLHNLYASHYAAQDVVIRHGFIFFITPKQILTKFFSIQKRLAEV
ncbi:hypothetical protein [Thioclava atlantica]|uniref:Helicase IV n=1 Tax=Thioclava atlantica TaxID=1317124 RepID=A0A085U0R7_9RHOB|nr:hypothetical protein [Thioclava atlantica]KFE36564.1 helicase IV [Thioclava atlantica]